MPQKEVKAFVYFLSDRGWLILTPLLDEFSSFLFCFVLCYANKEHQIEELTT